MATRNKQWQLAYAKKRRHQVYKYLRRVKRYKGCYDCGITDWRVLDFDHVRGTKTKRVSAMVNGYSLARIKEELRKCEVRCANCHRIKSIESYPWTIK